MRSIDADALERALGHLWRATAPRDTDDKETSLERAAMCRGIDDCIGIAQRAPTVGGWISVKDRLPESAGCMVLVSAHNSYYGTDRVFPAFLSYGTFNWCTYDTTMMQKDEPTDNRVSDRLTVTHWMPLPELPEVEG